MDEVTDRTWEVVGGELEEYDGGYSAYVLSKAERARQQAAMDARRNNLLRKELAWLRRGAPARTTKPKFRVDAANELIATEPPPRDNTELLKFSQNRLGNTVFECQHLQIRAGESVLLEDLVWNIGPGERIGIVGVNGAGKTTLMRTLAGEHFASAGKLVKGVTVKTAMLSQHLAELDPSWRLLEAVERVATRVELGGGRELSASQLCERLGFGRGECFVERYLDKPRHVETQVLVDKHGNAVVISTRDCSLQRRHQKLVEEAPAPFLTKAQNEELYRASKAIMKEAGYVGAGTCEFLVGLDGTISFLEVNTRLQVEHPVSEEVTGIDLVRQQFRIAGRLREGVS